MRSYWAIQVYFLAQMVRHTKIWLSPPKTWFVTSEAVCAPAFFIVTVAETSLRVKKPGSTSAETTTKKVVSSLVDRFL